MVKRLFTGGLKTAQEAPEGKYKLRRGKTFVGGKAQEGPGGLRRAQEGPGRPRRAQEGPGEPRRAQAAQEGPGKPTQGARKA